MYFTVHPKSTTISKLKATKKGFQVTWNKKANKQTTGYQIQYATDKQFKKNKKTVTVSKKSVNTKKISKLKGKKKYYVRVRVYKLKENKKYYSSWSKVKTITTKK